MKKILPLVMILLLILGCRHVRSPRDRLLFALRADPITLNPLLASDVPSMEVNSLIFNSLLKYDEKLHIVGELAERWKTSSEGKVWTFRLKRGINWHDGMPFTARDVEFTFKKILDPSTNTFNRGLFQVEGEDIEVQALDDLTVVFRLPSPFAPLESNLALQRIVPCHILEHADVNRCDFNFSPVGTGPFKFKRWLSSDSIALEANETYFAGKPRLRGIIYRIIPSAEARRIALLTGAVDMSGISTEDAKVLSRDPKITLYAWPELAYYYLGFDLTNRLFQDRRVRQAVSFAINTNKLVHAVMQGLGDRATGPIPPPSWAYSSRVPGYPYDPGKARRLLAEAGWTPNKKGILGKNQEIFEFDLRYSSGSPACEKAAVFIQAFLSEVGIKVNLRSTEFAALIRTCNPGEFQAVILDWVEGFDPDCFTEWDSSQIGERGMNFMSYSNPRADRLLRMARKELCREKRRILYERFQRIVVEDAPCVFLWCPRAVVAVNRRVGGLSSPGPAGLMVYPEKVFLQEE